jgi:hypothetical protein
MSFKGGGNPMGEGGNIAVWGLSRRWQRPTIGLRHASNEDLIWIKVVSSLFDVLG